MTPPRLDARLQRELAAWADAGLERRLEPMHGLDFCTNDYLALSRDPRLIEAACEATRACGAGARAARLLGGECEEHAAAETEAAAWLGTEAALLFPSGWHANLATLQVLPSRGDLILSDAGNHASLIDGMRLSSADVEIFAHNDADDLARRLERSSRHAQRWIVCESVYSTTGTLAPLAAYAALAELHDAWLIVDEAHAAGLYGKRGEGLAVGPGLGNRVAARTVTGGKALGAIGAFVACSAAMRALLLQRGRTFVFTTATPPGPVAALRRALEIVQQEPERRERVHTVAATLRAALRARGYDAPGSSPIVPVHMGDPELAVAVSNAMRAAGFEARAVRPPTVPPGGSCLRIVCHADHTDEQVTDLADTLMETVLPQPLRAAPPARTREPLVVLGTDTDVGKTVVSALLCRAALRAERTLHYLKPVQTGSDSDTEAVCALAGLPTGRSEPPLVALPLPASVDQAALDAGRRVTAAEVLGGIRSRLAGAPDATWILETAGGLLVPFNESEDQADVVAALGCPAVLVARSGLGTLNHTRLTLEAMRRRHIQPRALFLVGPRHEANVRTLRTLVPEVPLYELPHFDALDAAALDGWLDTTPLTELLP